MSTRAQDRQDALRLFNRLARITPCMAELSAQDTWIILSSLQLSYTHPRIGDGLKERLWQIGHELQEMFAPVPDIYDLADKGWDRAYDAPPAEEEEHQT